MMIKIVITLVVLSIASVIGYRINLSCNDYCNDCITSNISKDILYAPKYCEVSKEHTSFPISVRPGFNGCGYAKDIDDVYKKCANECQTCKKVDSKCDGILSRPSSTIQCKPLACIPRGGNCFARLCCDGLYCLNSKCADLSQDCTPCDSKVEPNKPCCSTSGIIVNGMWKCSSYGRPCKDDTPCFGDTRCISGYCKKP